jgi:tetratricopeptide (TPR) repeat protein
MNIADFVIGYEDFKSQYLATANGSQSAIDFWNTYNENPHELIRNRQYLALRDRLFGLLRACKSIDVTAFTKIPKGHPYYFIGISSYLLDDFQTAIYFFDAAVTEDLKAGVEPKTNPSPATRFLMLDGESDKQAAKKLTQDAQVKVDRALKYYVNDLTKDASIRILNLNDLCNDFIYYALITTGKPGLRTLVTAFITFCIEWDFRNQHFDYGVGKGTSEPFFLHLFRGCVLFESLVKLNPTNKPTKNTLVPMLNDLCSVLKIDEIKGKGKGQAYELRDLFDELQKYKKTISEAVKITAIARNTIGHDLGWNININQDQYRELYLIIAASCLHAIACLWKSSSSAH